MGNKFIMNSNDVITNDILVNSFLNENISLEFVIENEMYNML